MNQQEQMYETAVSKFSLYYENELKRLWPESGRRSIDKAEYERIKQEASDHAFDKVPLAKTLWNSYVQYRRENGIKHVQPDKVDDVRVKYGFRLINARGRAVGPILKEDRAKHGKRDPEETVDKEQEDMAETAKDLYINYIEEVGLGGFVPKDDVLAHFTPHTTGAFGAARWRARQDGYDFEKHEFGWIVTQVPQKVSREDLVDRIKNMSEEEAEALYDLLFDR